MAGNTHQYQMKRTSVAGRLANTTDPANTSYIPAGGLAVNFADRLVYTSDGSNLFVVGGGDANNANYLGGASLANIQSQIAGNSATAYSNAVANAAYQAGVAYSNAIGVAAADATSKAATAYANAVANAAALYQTTAGLSANVATLQANVATYLGNSQGTWANTVALIGNAYSNAIANAASNAAGIYQTMAGLSANVLTLTANSANYIGSIPANNVSTVSSNTKLVSTNYSVLSTDDFIIANGTINIQLGAVSVGTKKYNIQNGANGQVTVLPNGTDTINGKANVVLLYKNSLIGVMPSNSSNWLIF
jgi:hypothetical protein